MFEFKKAEAQCLRASKIAMGPQTYRHDCERDLNSYGRKIGGWWLWLWLWLWYVDLPKVSSNINFCLKRHPNFQKFVNFGF